MEGSTRTRLAQSLPPDRLEAMRRDGTLGDFLTTRTAELDDLRATLTKQMQARIEQNDSLTDKQRASEIAAIPFAVEEMVQEEMRGL